MPKLDPLPPLSAIALEELDAWPSLAKFKLFLDTARSGALYAYHYGQLACDRGKFIAVLTVGEGQVRQRRLDWVLAPEVENLARLAWAAEEAGFVTLFQRPVSPGVYAYLAKKLKHAGLAHLLGCTLVPEEPGEAPDAEAEPSLGNFKGD